MGTMRQEARKLIEAKLTESTAAPKSFMAAIDGYIDDIVQAIAKGFPRNMKLDDFRTSSKGETYGGGFIHATGTSKSDLECHSEVFVLQRRDNMSFEAKCRWFDASGKTVEMEYVLRSFDSYDTLVHKVLQWFSQF